jgi:hypothetical protein
VESWGLHKKLMESNEKPLFFFFEEEGSEYKAQAGAGCTLFLRPIGYFDIPGSSWDLICYAMRIRIPML